MWEKTKVVVEVWEAFVVVRAEGVAMDVVCRGQETFGGRGEAWDMVAEARLTEGEG